MCELACAAATPPQEASPAFPSASVPLGFVLFLLIPALPGTFHRSGLVPGRKVRITQSAAPPNGRAPARESDR